jgi:predicted lipid carrier protein YhbT
MNDLRIATRGERLDFLLELARHRDAIALAIPDDLELSDDERADVALTNALLDVEHECKARQWAALEALLPLIPPGGDEREVVYLPRRQALRAVRLTIECGWFWDADE